MLSQTEGYRSVQAPGAYSRSRKVGNPIASIVKSNAQGIPALFDLNPVSNFMGFTVIKLMQGRFVNGMG